MKRFLLFGLGLAAIVGTGAILLGSPSSADPPDQEIQDLPRPVIAPQVITPNVRTRIAIVVEIDDSRLTNHQIQNLDERGRWKHFGNLRDDGRRGDQLAGDHLFTLVREVRDRIPTTISLRAHARMQHHDDEDAHHVVHVSAPAILGIWSPVTVGEEGVSFNFPPALTLKLGLVALGGPITLDNFDGAYGHGGLLPPNGASINIGRFPLPSLPLTDVIEQDLAGAVIESLTDITVSEIPAKRVVYRDQYLPTLAYRGVVVYVPSSAFLFKVTLSFVNGNPVEATLIQQFDALVGTIQLAP